MIKIAEGIKVAGILDRVAPYADYGALNIGPAVMGGGLSDYVTGNEDAGKRMRVLPVAGALAGGHLGSLGARLLAKKLGISNEVATGLARGAGAAAGGAGGYTAAKALGA